MNTSVTFETAKLLIEKGIIVKSGVKGFSSPYYNHLGELDGDVTELVKAQIHEEDTTPYQTIPAPLIADVVMWLYEKHGIWIGVNKMFTEEFDVTIMTDTEYTSKEFQKLYLNPSEAYEAAITYTLNNLV